MRVERGVVLWWHVLKWTWWLSVCLWYWLYCWAKWKIMHRYVFIDYIYM